MACLLILYLIMLPNIVHFHISVGKHCGHLYLLYTWNLWTYVCSPATAQLAGSDVAEYFYNRLVNCAQLGQNFNGYPENYALLIQSRY